MRSPTFYTTHLAYFWYLDKSNQFYMEFFPIIWVIELLSKKWLCHLCTFMLPKLKLNESTNFNVGNKEVLDSKSTITQTYMESFTCHGLSRIFTGRCWEKVLWFILIAGCASYVIHLTSIMVSEYMQFKIRTETSIREEEEIPLPTVTACLKVSPYNLLMLL